MRDDEHRRQVPSSTDDREQHTWSNTDLDEIEIAFSDGWEMVEDSHGSVHLRRDVPSGIASRLMPSPAIEIEAQSPQGAPTTAPAGSSGSALQKPAIARKRNKHGSRRKRALLPILCDKGFSVLDWAKEANVDFHTANDYLNGNTHPYPSTLKKLAAALGLPASTMPQ